MIIGLHLAQCQLNVRSSASVLVCARRGHVSVSQCQSQGALPSVHDDDAIAGYVGGWGRSDQKKFVDTADSTAILARDDAALRPPTEPWHMHHRILTVATLAMCMIACGRSQPVAVADTATVEHSHTALAAAGRAAEVALALGRVRVRGRSDSPVWQVEIAERPDDRGRGLMFRRALPDDRGMIFLMPNDDDWAFYMRNTYVPLDMIFIDRGWRVVGISANTRPLTEALHRPGRPCRYILELAAHQARRNGITVGTRLEFERSPPADKAGAR